MQSVTITLQGEIKCRQLTGDNSDYYYTCEMKRVKPVSLKNEITGAILFEADDFIAN